MNDLAEKSPTYLTADETGRPRVVNADGQEVTGTGANYLTGGKKGVPVVRHREGAANTNRGNQLRFDGSGRPFVEDRSDPGTGTARDLRNALARERTAKDRVARLETENADLKEQVENLKKQVAVLNELTESPESGDDANDDDQSE